jgi:tetratricopeptide (TPR) repeat protein
MRAVAVFGAAVTMLSIAGGAQAQTQQLPLHTACADDKSPPEMRIGACSIIILSEKVTPRDLAVTYNNRGIGYAAEGDDDRAMADYTKAIELDPKFALAYYNRGNLYIHKGDKIRAVADYTKAIEIDPKDGSAYNNRCLARATSGQAKLALSDCDAALRIKPGNANALSNRGFTYYMLGRYDEALADYDAALKVNPTSADSLYGRGMTKLKMGDPGGNADTAAATAIQPDIADEMARYGMK